MRIRLRPRSCRSAPRNVCSVAVVRGGSIQLRTLSAYRVSYSTVWRVHLEPRWGALKLRQVDAEGVARWKQEKLDAGVGARTMLCALQVLAAVFKHARRFGWTTANPLENVHRPRHQYEVKAFTPEQIGALLEVADPETGLIVRMFAATGLRFGEVAGLRWSAVDLERGVIEVREQFTHGDWSELKTANARRSIPLPSALRELLKARYRALNHGSVVLRPREDDRLVFTSPRAASSTPTTGARVSGSRCLRRHILTPSTRSARRSPVRRTCSAIPTRLR